VNIGITDRAASRIREAAEHEGVDLTDSFLRIGVVSGGCSGLTYDLGWDTVRREEDEMGEIAGLRVILDLNSYLYLEGSTLDFTDGLEGKGFHFDNPQASRTCACGESFSV
jgi:iron-sulfur cluster assembly protein